MTNLSQHCLKNHRQVPCFYKGHSPSPSAGFHFLYIKLSFVLCNIDSSIVRPEYSLKICTAYALPSQFALDRSRPYKNTTYHSGRSVHLILKIPAFISSFRDDIRSLRPCLSKHTYHNLTLLCMSRLFLRSTFSIP